MKVVLFRRNLFSRGNIFQGCIRSLFSAAATWKEVGENPFYAKYKSKLERVQGDLSYVKARSDKIPPISAEGPQYVQGSKTFSRTLDLNKLMKVELIDNKSSDEISKVWVEYHKTKDCISWVLPSPTYLQLHAKSVLSPLMVYPLPRDDGYEMWFSQFSEHRCYFTSLINYQMYQDNAPTSFTLSFFTEFLESKGIVLVHGEVDTTTLNTLQAQNLTNLMQMYYTSIQPEFYQLVREFNHNPQNFDYKLLINI